MLKLEFKPNHWIKSKGLNWAVKNVLINYKKWKTQNQKQSETIYCLGCTDYTKKFRPQEVKMTNKVLREKSHCVVCRSNKSRFLKQKIN